MTSNTIRPMSVKLDSDTRTRIAKLAAVRRRSTHWIMRDAIQQYVEHEEKREYIPPRHTQGLGRISGYRFVHDR